MITIKKLSPILDHIIVTDMNFGEQVTSGGIILRSDNGKSEGVKPRWAKVFAIGPDQDQVSVGDWVLVEHGRWTRGFEIQFEDDDSVTELFRIDPEGIIMSADTPPTDASFGSYTTPSQPGLSDFIV